MCETNSSVYAKMKLKVMLIGFNNFIQALTGFGFSLYVIVMEDYKQMMFKFTSNLQHALNMNIDSNVIYLVAGIIGVIYLLAMIFSVLLVIGIKKNKPGFVLAYFGYSTMLTMLIILSALLELIQCYWIIAICTTVLSFFYIWSLSTVYIVYDMMQNGLILSTDGHNLIENEY
ncbi:uncharacterized protein LOC126769759 [Nymphalis io]|uniref:uncharacterized protein LOC126769759 n=1 Tax=Inachis io TaxID=171585 RepID=UPI00216962E2|nr:uncharacterized protein LOC126769759 [Nymphalis io]